MTNQVIAIDGPAAAGKTTVAELLARRIGALFFDTGALYRAVTLLALREGVALDDAEALAALVEQHDVDIRPASVNDGRQYDVLVDDEDVTWDIRETAVNAAVSPVSAHPAVRAALLPVQRRIGQAGPVVMVGRDVGTVVFPDASVKIYLDASHEERARRRHEEIVARGGTASHADVLADLRRRDAADSEREAAPLRAAPDAFIVNTDGLTIPEVVKQLKSIVDAAWMSAPA